MSPIAVHGRSISTLPKPSCDQGFLESVSGRFFRGRVNVTFLSADLYGFVEDDLLSLHVGDGMPEALSITCLFPKSWKMKMEGYYL